VSAVRAIGCQFRRRLSYRENRQCTDLALPTTHAAHILAAELDRARQDMQDMAKARAKRNCPASMALTIVHRADGKPYTGNGFNTIWLREQERLRCQGMPFHGLRKNATAALVEAGCSVQQVQAITGHVTLEMVAHYGRGADQKRLAKEAMRKLTDGCDED
jgi:integrase